MPLYDQPLLGLGEGARELLGRGTLPSRGRETRIRANPTPLPRNARRLGRPQLESARGQERRDTEAELRKAVKRLRAERADEENAKQAA
jgi:hypothetical protein